MEKKKKVLPQDDFNIALGIVFMDNFNWNLKTNLFCFCALLKNYCLVFSDLTSMEFSEFVISLFTCPKNK